MAIVATLILLAATLVAYLVWRNGHITLVKADRWAAQRGLILTSENREVVTDYLHTAGLLRGLGLVFGLVLPQLYAWALGARGSGAFPWTWAFLGYLIGALYAEISLRRPRAGRAAAVPRDLRNYLRPLLLRGQVVLGVVLAIASVGAWRASGTFDVLGHTRVPLIVTGLAALIGAPLLLAVETWLVRRPQPVLSPAQLAADDAIRSQSVQSIAASGMAMQLALMSVPLWAMAASDVQFLRWTMWLPAMLSAAFALFVCLEFGHLSWSVRRHLPEEQMRTTPC